MAIRYDDKLNQQLVRTVRNFNAKINRLERQGVSVPVQKVTVKQLRQDFTERRELLSYLRELRKFSQRGVERIAYIEKWGDVKKEYSVYEFKVGGIRQRRAIREAERLLKKASETHRTEGGKEGPETLMGTDYARNIEANLQKLRQTRYNINRLSNRKKAQLLRASKAILGSRKFQIAVKENFFKHLRILGEAAGLGQSYIDEIITVLQKVPPVEFERMRHAEELINTIETYYPQWKDAKTPTEKAAVGNSVRPYIEALHDNILTIAMEYGVNDDSE